MKTPFNTYLILFIASLFVPYVTLVYISYTGSNNFFLSLLIIIEISFPFFLVTTLMEKVQSNFTKKDYLFTTITVSLLSLFVLFNGTVYNWLFFKFREEKLTLFISEFKKYKKIKEISDGQRYWKTINFTSIEPNRANADTSKEYDKKYFLDDILRREQIDKEHYEFFRKLLIETSLITCTTLHDGTISFTLDGFLDNCSGIAYSETGMKPYQNDCGTVVKWKKVGNNWYAWVTT